MNPLSPYLFFDGNCREAMNFYRNALGGEVELMTFGDTQGDKCPTADRDKIMHGILRRGGLVLMASDSPDEATVRGDNMQLCLNCETPSEIESVFKALGEGGKIKVALHDAFWGARFGMLTDRYGIHWMLNHELNKKK